MNVFSKTELLPRIGDISQIGGLRRYTLSEGRAKGVEAIDVRTGAGLCFTVLADRCLDIAWADFKATPLTHITKGGIVGPAYYEKDGNNWLRTFSGGLLTTCGLSNVGWPCMDDADPFGLDRQHGLHGRISTTPAENLAAWQGWEGETFVMRLSGTMRQAYFKGDHLTLTRRITARLGENSFALHDTVENHTRVAVPLMILYHCNFGWPLLDEGTELVAPSAVVTPDDEGASRAGLDSHHVYPGPLPDTPYQLYYHDLRSDENGATLVALVNHKLGLGACLRFNRRQLPRFAQWKDLRSGDYITGLEPTNCRAEGCDAARRNGRLETIEPGQTREFGLEYGVLDGAAAIASRIAEIEALRQAGATLKGGAQ